MIRNPFGPALAATLLLAGCGQAPVTGPRDPSPALADNPLAAASPLPMQAPPFDRIRSEHYRPALEEGMRLQLAELRLIADNPAPPTFENTLVAWQRSGRLLQRARRAFDLATSTRLDDTLQRLQTELAPVLARHADRITLDAPLFARLHRLYEQRAALGLDAPSLRLLECEHRHFVSHGAQLAPGDQDTLRALNQEAATLVARFQEAVLQETNDGAVVVDSPDELAGLSAADLAAAAAAASARGLAGRWVIPLVNTTRQPVQAQLANRALRERIQRASEQRGCHGGPHDTRALVARLAQLRATRARLLGFAGNADLELADQMAKTPQAAMALLEQVAPAAVAQARRETAEMQALIDREHGGFTLQPWDWAFYAEQVRQQRFALDQAQVRPYLALDHVLRDGVFFAAHRLYGIDVRERHDLPTYDPDAQVWEVTDADGSTIGLLYTDCYARPSKRGGAWMDALIDQSDLLGTRAVVINELNIARPAAGQPALLTFDEVTTLFHEFGHALHGLLSQVRYPSQSGTSTARDFVEFPSQFNEEWALEPSVLANYARHFQTGEPMPAELVARIRQAATFHQGFATLEYVAAALIDLEWNALPADAGIQDPVAFEQAALARHHVDLAAIPPRYHSWYFSHIWGGGYAAGYYAYLWTAVLGADAADWFAGNGGMTAANGRRFRERVLSRGGTLDEHQLWLDFRGQEPDIGPLLRKRGLDGR